MTRELSKTGRKMVRVTGCFSNWPLTEDEMKGRKTDDLVIPVKRWQALLGKMLFNLPIEGFDEITFMPPSARELFNYFNRKSFDSISKSVKQQKSEQSKLSTAYLLGLNWEYLDELRKFRKEEETVKSLEKSSEHILKKAGITMAELKSQCADLEARIGEIDESLKNFKVEPAVEEQLKEVERVSEELRAAQRAVKRLIQSLNLTNAAIDDLSDDTEALKRFYHKANIELGPVIKKQLDEVAEFHQNVHGYRRKVLEREREELERKLEKARAYADALDAKRSEFVVASEARSIIEEFHRHQELLADLRAELEEKRRAIDLHNEANSEQLWINTARHECANRESVRFTALHDHWSSLSNRFEVLTADMYGEENKGELTFNFINNQPIKKGAKGKFDLIADATIPGDNGPGKGHVKVCAYDLLVFRLSKELGRGIDFLMHDSPAFEPADMNQVGRLMLKAAELADREDLQYICALDRTNFELACKNNPGLRDLLKSENTTILSEDRRLFGVKFHHHK